MSGQSLHFYPATIVQRFKAAILDAGLLLSFLTIIVLLYYTVTGAPDGGMRYVPPHPDMSPARALRPFLLFGIAALWLAAFLSSKWRATPGMMAVQIRAHGALERRLTFFRAFGWIFTAWAPLLTATALVMTGIYFQTPLLHTGRLDLFSVLMVLQCVWFIPLLVCKDRRAVHDRPWHIRFYHYTDKPPGLVHALMAAPFYVLITALLAGALTLFAVNLIDQSAHLRLESFKAAMPENNRSLIASWRGNSADSGLEMVPDFRCISRQERFHLSRSCPKNSAFHLANKAYAARAKDYIREVASPAGAAPLPYWYATVSGLHLTDIALADIVLRLEKNPLDTGPFREWLAITSRWRMEMFTPGPLHIKAAVLMNYNKVLSALPVLASAQPSIMDNYKSEINAVIEPVPLGDMPLDEIIAHEYRFFNWITGSGQIDYFPLIQPAHTRNQFVIAAAKLESLFASNDPGNDFHEVSKWFARNDDSISLYNPLGMRFRDMALSNMASNLHIVTTYHHNNALKRMLQVYVESRSRNIKDEEMADFLASLPAEQKTAIGQSLILWDRQAHTLYYIMPGLRGFRRELPI